MAAMVGVVRTHGVEEPDRVGLDHTLGYFFGDEPGERGRLTLRGSGFLRAIREGKSRRWRDSLDH
jgi:hypothetical protein